jgi:hypothetical protein
MKKFFELVPALLKSDIGLVVFWVGIGWTGYSSINLIVKAESKEIRREVKEIRSIDTKHFDNRFDRIENRFDQLENLIKDVKK